MRRPVVAILTAAVAIAIVLAIATVLVLEHTHNTGQTPAVTHTPGRAASTPRSTSTSSASSAPAPTDTQLIDAIDSFAKGYGRYLNGGSAAGMNTHGTVTSMSEAEQEGRIPTAFRDGPIELQQLSSLQSTCCSASVTVVLANREQTYPFGEQLLYEGGRWLVDQITAADLSMDRHLPAPTHVTDPAGGQAAARAFALAYVNYKSGISTVRPAMTAAAAAQMATATDSLAGERLTKQPATLTAIKFAPPSGQEFAATATVRIGASRASFSFLMTKTPAGWKCGQFL